MIYDSSKVIWFLVHRHDMDPQDASEYFSFNIECAYLGPGTPIFI